MRIEGERVVVTGAASGIGAAMAARVADAGGTPICVDVDAAATEAVAERHGGVAIVGSVADPDLWDRVVDAGPVHAAHLNAGVYGFGGPIDELPLEQYRRTVDANVDGVVLGTRALVAAMRGGDGGSIVVTASVAGIVAFEGNPVYTLTKQAVAGFVCAVAPSLAPSGIGIDAVCPAIVDTPMTAEATGDRSARLSDLVDTSGLLSPDRIAEVALDLLQTSAPADGDTARCRAVRQDGSTVDWAFPTWGDLARA